jgi:membrane associated rhomboid family serine protease
MFIPLHDANTLKRIRHQYVTIALILANAAVYALTVAEGEFWTQGAVIEFGYIPAVVFDHADLPPGYAVIPEQLTFLTYAFFHADFLHLAGNMLFLWVFGDNVEDAMGHARFLVFYLLSAAAGAAFHGFVDPESQAPLIGASGAVAGIIAAYLILHPRVKVWVLAFGRIPLRIPAWIALAAWIIFQFAMFLSGLDEQVSFSAHIGGVIAGALLVLALRRRDQPVLDRQLVIPRAMIRREPGAVPPVSAPAGRWGRQ